MDQLTREPQHDTDAAPPKLGVYGHKNGRKQVFMRGLRLLDTITVDGVELTAFSTATDNFRFSADGRAWSSTIKRGSWTEVALVLDHTRYVYHVRDRVNALVFLTPKEIKAILAGRAAPAAPISAAPPQPPPPPASAQDGPAAAPPHHRLLTDKYLTVHRAGETEPART